jgi:hypothetical protein
MKISSLILYLFLCSSALAQTNELSTLEKAQSLVKKIFDANGLNANDINVVEIDAVENARADFNSTTKVRYIYYNRDFINSLYENNKNWSFICVLAHEIGHLLNYDVFENGVPSSMQELNADAFAGCTLGRLKASLNEAKNCAQIFSIDATLDHPGREDRKKAIENGWKKCNQSELKCKIEVTYNGLGKFLNGNDAVNCAIFVKELKFDGKTMSIAGKPFPFKFENIKCGDISYYIEANISCGVYGWVMAEGRGTIKIEDASTLYIKWEQISTTEGTIKIEN